MAKEDYYDLLGVSRDATAADLKKAYRKMAVKYHPDKNGGDKAAEEMFKKVSEAYEILNDADKKAAYDRFGHAAFAQGGPRPRGNAGAGGFHDPFDMFKEVFGGQGGGIFEEMFGGRGQGGAKVQRGSDLRYDLEITLEEAAAGVEKEIQYRHNQACSSCSGSGSSAGSKKSTCHTCNGSGSVVASQGFFSVRQTCPSCHGAGSLVSNPCSSCKGGGRNPKTNTIKLKVPKGIDTGNKLRSSGGGDAGPTGGPAGDLYVVVHVKEHDFFERHGEDLFCEIAIKFTLAALGGNIDVPTLEGKVSLKIPEGTQSGTTFRLRNKGMPSLSGNYRGDQLVKIEVDVPKKLSAKQREILESFAIECGDADNPIGGSFFDKAKKIFK